MTHIIAEHFNDGLGGKLSASRIPLNSAPLFSDIIIKPIITITGGGRIWNFLTIVLLWPINALRSLYNVKTK